MLKDRAAIQHVYGVGPTGSGKSYIGKKRAREIRMAGYPVYVCSKKARPEVRKMLGGEHPDVKEWRTKCGASFITHDPLYFPNLFWAGQLGPCLLVYDEGSADIGMNPPKEIDDMIKVCRDLGVMFWINSQNYTAVSPQVRNQCKELYLFNCAQADIRYVINDYRFDLGSEQTIKKVTDLRLYEHLHIDSRNRVAEIVGADGRPIANA